MQTNVIGISQFADGGVLASKPNAASANYINKMSDYCGSCVYKQQECIGEKAYLENEGKREREIFMTCLCAKCMASLFLISFTGIFSPVTATDSSLKVEWVQFCVTLSVFPLKKYKKFIKKQRTDTLKSIQMSKALIKFFKKRQLNVTAEWTIRVWLIALLALGAEVQSLMSDITRF